VKWVIQLLGHNGQQNLQELLRAKQSTDSSLTRIETSINNIAKSPSSMAACKEVTMAVRKFAKHFEDVIKENLDPSISEDGLIQAARNHGNSTRSQMLGFKLGLEAKLALAVQWDGLLAMWKDPKSEASRELKDYSRGKNRFLKQGVSNASLGTQLLFDKTDENWVNLLPID
jgi:hypothetical protein